MQLTTSRTLWAWRYEGANREHTGCRGTRWQLMGQVHAKSHLKVHRTTGKGCCLSAHTNQNCLPLTTSQKYTQMFFTDLPTAVSRQGQQWLFCFDPSFLVYSNHLAPCTLTCNLWVNHTGRTFIFQKSAFNASEDFIIYLKVSAHHELSVANNQV